MATRKQSPLTFVLNNLYTNRRLDWLNEVDNNVSPFIIQRCLAMNDMLRAQVRWLDKYVFALQSDSKLYMSLAWSIIPKVNKAPYYPYIKKVDEIEEFDFILSRVRKHFTLADNDYNRMKNRILTAIKKDMVNWFSFYGIDKKYWKQYYLNFNLIKEFGEKAKPKTESLDKWGL